MGWGRNFPFAFSKVCIRARALGKNLFSVRAVKAKVDSSACAPASHAPSECSQRWPAECWSTENVSANHTYDDFFSRANTPDR